MSSPMGKIVDDAVLRKPRSGRFRCFPPVLLVTRFSGHYSFRDMPSLVTAGVVLPHIPLEKHANYSLADSGCCFRCPIGEYEEFFSVECSCWNASVGGADQ